MKGVASIIVRYGRNMKNFPEVDFRDDVAIQQWSRDTDDPDLLTNELVWMLDACAEKHWPTERLNPKKGFS